MPDYIPGRLVSISHKNASEFPFYTFDYTDESVIYSYHVDNEIITAEFFMSGNIVDKKIFSVENSLQTQAPDSALFCYRQDSAFRYRYYANGNTDTMYYFMENAIVVSELEYVPQSDPFIQEMYYSGKFEWNDGNILKYESFYGLDGSEFIDYSFEFEYADVENPVFRSNLPSIPRINLLNIQLHDLAEVLLSCNRSFPSLFRCNNGDGELLFQYTFEIISYIDEKPYEVRMNFEQAEAGGYGYSDYILEYEEL